MTRVYMIANLRIEDADTYRIYEKGFFPILKKHGGEFVTFDDEALHADGTRSIEGRVVIFSFPSAEAARTWYDDPEYQEISKARRAGTHLFALTMVEELTPRDKGGDAPGAYMVANIHIEDRETYGKYQDGFMPILEKYGGSALAVDDAPVHLEGSQPWEGRVVVLTFATPEAVRDWYGSPEYQKIAKIRQAASSMAFSTLVKGLPPRA